MKQVPATIIRAIEGLTPDDMLTIHRGREGWAKIELVQGENRSQPVCCPRCLWEPVFLALPDDWVGGITFEYAPALHAWTYRIRTCPIVDNKDMMLLSFVDKEGKKTETHGV